MLFPQSNSRETLNEKKNHSKITVEEESLYYPFGREGSFQDLSWPKVS